MQKKLLLSLLSVASISIQQFRYSGSSYSFLIKLSQKEREQFRFSIFSFKLEFPTKIVSKNFREMQKISLLSLLSVAPISDAFCFQCSSLQRFPNLNHNHDQNHTYNHDHSPYQSHLDCWAIWGPFWTIQEPYWINFIY